jgi:hypothetical protein
LQKEYWLAESRLGEAGRVFGLRAWPNNIVVLTMDFHLNTVPLHIYLDKKAFLL